jgi:indole-3-glycerol phosphate synthase
MTILDKIIATKKQELIELKQLRKMSLLEKSKHFGSPVYSLTSSLDDKERTGIIAEFKRKSPSKGVINQTSTPKDVTSGYFREGAAGVSILTDNNYFGGNVNDLLSVRDQSTFPILRKEFIIDEYHVIESRSVGADVILLIAAVLDKTEILTFARLARSLGMEVILEIHDKMELEKINQYINIVGVNNRDLKTFNVRVETSLELSVLIPVDFRKISESGISSPETIRLLREHGFNGFLIGENFMKSNDPVMAFSMFVKEMRQLQ